MKSPFDDLVPPTRWPELGLRKLLVLFVIAVGLLCVASLAWPQAQYAPRDICREVALYVATAAWARDMRASRDRVLADVRRRTEHLGQARAAGVEREARRAWLLGLEPDEALQASFDRCMARLGDFEEEG